MIFVCLFLLYTAFNNSILCSLCAMTLTHTLKIKKKNKGKIHLIVIDYLRWEKEKNISLLKSIIRIQLWHSLLYICTYLHNCKLIDFKNWSYKIIAFGRNEVSVRLNCFCVCRKGVKIIFWIIKKLKSKCIICLCHTSIMPQLRCLCFISFIVLCYAYSNKF